MTFNVQGYHEGVFYSADVGGEPNDRGVVLVGSNRAAALVDLYDGTRVMVGPDQIKVDKATPEGVLAALSALTTVVSVTGDDVPTFGVEATAENGLIR